MLQGIEPRKFLQSRGNHLTLYEQNKEPNNVSPSIWHHLEHCQAIEVQDLPEELV